MRELLKKIDEAGIVLDLIDGNLKLYTEKEEVEADLLNEIKEKKSKIIAYLIQNEVTTIYENTYEPISRVTWQESYPLSDAQRRLWILNQFEDAFGVYNMPNTIVLKGEYDIECFEKALKAVINRHEILRTVFRKEERANGEKESVRQWILEVEEIGFEIKQFNFFNDENRQSTNTESNDAEEKAFDWIRTDTTRPFDLENGPLVRAALFQIGQDEYIFYYNIHHIISDGWSMQVLTNDVFRFYEAFVQNSEPDIEELPIQYKDYASWQLKQVNTEAFLQHKTYWLEKLSGNLPVIDLPTANKRPEFKTHNGRVLSTLISAKNTENLKSFVENEGGSLFMSLLTAWNICVSQYSGETDIIVGTPIAGREHADLNNQIGFYVNMIPLRNQVDSKESFKAFYTKVKANVLSGFAHQMYPFDRLVDELELNHRKDRTAVFDILFALQNQSDNTSSDVSETANSRGRDWSEVIDRGETAAKYDIEVSLEEKGKYFALNVIFNVDVYRKKMVSRLINQFKAILDTVMGNPEIVIGDIPLLSKGEKEEQQLLFNKTKKEFPHCESLLEVFAKKVAENPNHVALIVPQEKEDVFLKLTFDELDKKSNQLANYLLDKYTLKKGDLVGLKLERNEWMLISILAVMKAGATYLPIDRQYPEDRINFMQEDAKCKVLLKPQELEEIRWTTYTEMQPEVDIKSRDLAYVIYTSGSTGQPKGVMISHGAILNTLFAQIDTFELNKDVIGLQFASFSFDASISETFITLLSGGTLVIADEDTRKSPDSLVQLINNCKVNLATLPPTYLSKIDASQLSGITKLISAGESPNYSRALAHLDYGAFFNAYGPTETAICATIYTLKNTGEGDIKNLPVGKPIANTQIYILSEKSELLPTGGIGEICIGGEGLAMGYLNRPQLTEERFIVHPLNTNERVYRTGDLGKWLPDGNLEFLGRKDDQVKVRGYRVELGEVEHALRSNKDLIQAVVLVKRNQENLNELVAYFTAHEEQNMNNIRSQLNKILPAHMIPTYFVQVEEFLLTAHGKIDKKSLPEPDGLEISSGTAFVAPRNEIEKKVVEVWKMVLNKTNVSIYDDFHELGGYSVKAIGLVAEYNKTFNVRLNLKEIYQRTRLFEHAELIEIRSWVNENANQDNEEQENLETFEF